MKKILPLLLLLLVPLVPVYGGDFVTNRDRQIATKSGKKALPAGASAENYVTATDWNRDVKGALEDVRGALWDVQGLAATTSTRVNALETNRVADRLSTTPTVCPVGQAPQGIDARGNATGCISATFPGVSSDGSRGMIVQGRVQSGAGEPTVINVTTLTIDALQATTTSVAGDHRMVSNGINSADCSIGGGISTHWCYWDGSQWLAELTVGPPGATAVDLGTLTWSPSGVTTMALLNSQWVGGMVIATHGTTSTLNLTNPVKWGSYLLEVRQDSTGGGASLTLGTGCVWKVGGSGGVHDLTTSASANAIDVLAWTYDGTNCLAVFRQDFN